LPERLATEAQAVQAKKAVSWCRLGFHTFYLIGFRNRLPVLLDRVYCDLFS